MTMTENQIFRCQNRSCGCEVRVIKPSIEAMANPRCCCGAEMKKPYTSPIFTRTDSKVLAGRRIHEN
jgi:hypothetical protein